ncbi:MAG: hypothetical protein GXY58_02770 [Planctomycetaceae bacterium]|nr:hypothetical protein [Planctomycetaceae bacterium]
MTQTQQGFYRTSTPESGGPAAATADARSSGWSAPDSQFPAPAYASSAYPAPTGGGAPYQAAVPPAAGSYAPVTTPAPNYGAPDAQYPQYPASVAIPPANAYPTTVAGDSYPVARPDQFAPQVPTGAYPATAAVPPNYGAAPYTAAPANYADAPVYDASSQYGNYATGGEYPATANAAGSPSASGGYLPGSTSRNSSLLSPAAGTPPVTTPADPYPGTYSR